MRTVLTSDQLASALALRDLTDPSQGDHAMQVLILEIMAKLDEHLAIPLSLHRVSPIVKVAQNYDALRIGADVATRAERYSRYISDDTMLRSHTSAHLPDLLATYAHRRSVDELVLVPGLVYRRDQVDRSHVGEPHQMDLWRISDKQRLNEHDLTQLLSLVANAVLPGADWRVTPVDHTYTLHGLQLDVLWDGEWLELAEGGLAHPEVLHEAGLDPLRWSGLAMGMGLDRGLLLRKRIPDIRYLRSANPRAVAQMNDLQVWQEVSQQPEAKRDISIMVWGETDEEILGDKALTALGKRATALESLTILSLTQGHALPPQAHLRMGSVPAQTNILVRLVLRDLDRTLSSDEANELRNLVYGALHEGRKWEY